VAAKKTAVSSFAEKGLVIIDGIGGEPRPESKVRADAEDYRIMWGGIPSPEDMGRIWRWTQGAVTANSFFDIEKWMRDLEAKRTAA
jgi:hypothetical protein